MAGPLAEPLAAGEARCTEVTFRNSAAEGVLRVGAGMVLTPG
jgi:hypothetical protein